MALTVNTNIASLTTQNNLSRAFGNLQTSMQRTTPVQLAAEVRTLAVKLPQTSSWLADGPNQPVSPEELAAAMGEESLAGLADAPGQDKEAFVAELSQTLPVFIDSISIGGQVDEALAAEALAQES